MAKSHALWNGAIALEVWNIFWVDDETIPEDMLARRDYIVDKRENDGAWKILQTMVMKETAEMKATNDRFHREACQYQGGNSANQPRTTPSMQDNVSMESLEEESESEDEEAENMICTTDKPIKPKKKREKKAKAPMTE